MSVIKACAAIAGMAVVTTFVAVAQIPTTATPTVIVSTSAEPVANGRFQPTWESSAEVTLVGSAEKLKWTQTADALVIEKSQNQPSDIAIVFKITPKG